MPPVSVVPTMLELMETVDNRTLAKGEEYYRAGYVIETRVERDAVYGDVRGSGLNVYSVVIPRVRSGRFLGRCDCPVSISCKHTVAVALAAMREPRTTPPTWRRVVDALDRSQRTDIVRETIAVGLQFEVADSMTFAVGSLDPEPSQALWLRLVARGARGDWIRSKVTWGDVGLGRSVSGFSDGAYTSRNRLVPEGAYEELALLGSWFGRTEPSSSGGQAVCLDRNSAVIWRFLDALVDLGVPMIFGKGGDVELHRTPIKVRSDVVRADDGLQLRAALDGIDVSDESSLTLLGSPVFGVWQVVDGTLHLWRPESGLGELERALLESGPIDVPADDVGEFTSEYLPQLARSQSVASTDGSVTIPTAPVITPAAIIKYDGDVARVRPGYSYDFGGDDVRVIDVKDHQDWRESHPEWVARRELDLSDPALSTITEAPREGGIARSRRIKDRQFRGSEILTLLHTVLPALRTAGVAVIERGDRLDYREPESEPVVVVDVTDTPDRDWFDLAVRVTVDDTEIPFGQLFSALMTGQTLVRPDGLILDVSGPEFDQLRHLIEQAETIGDPSSGSLAISPVQLGLYDQLVALGIVGRQSRRWRERVAGLRSLDELPAIDVPDDIDATLRPYQVAGFRWLSALSSIGIGGILADDMGLGKTLQVLTAVVHARNEQGMRDPVLVVAPTSVVANWQQEAERFAPGLTVSVVTAGRRRRDHALVDAVAGSDIVVTSYNLLRLGIEEYAEIPWSWVVLDEAQLVKNYRGKAYQSVRRLRAESMFALSGTPLENNLMDLWALLSIVAPGLFSDPQRFTDDYRRPIERTGDKKRAAILRARIAPVMLRRTKELVAPELPPKQEQVLRVDLSPKHRKMYDVRLQRVRGQVLGLLDDLSRNRISVLASLTALRQLALSPMLDADPAPETAEIPNAKIDLLIERLHELHSEGHRALVFSQFTRFLKQVRSRLDDEGLSYEYLDGRTRKRAEAVRRFTEGDSAAFLISLKAGGVGLNLTEADYCFVLDPWWNPAAEAQAIDRTHRIGQDKPVMVYRVIAGDTIEEKVLQLQQRKRELFAQVVGDGSEVAGQLDADDLRSLLD